MAVRTRQEQVSTEEQHQSVLDYEKSWQSQGLVFVSPISKPLQSSLQEVKCSTWNLAMGTIHRVKKAIHMCRAH